jgi:hypothetical protein
MIAVKNTERRGLHRPPGVTLGGLTGAPAMREIKLEVMRHSHANRTVSGKENRSALKLPKQKFYPLSTGLN